ncbi:MAG: Ig-like domain-containing protein, partial [Erysipelotrichaceae bacterium]|nr:Ig-like domain-containing protein [Erysipelotrichaceae bacterium]
GSKAEDTFSVNQTGSGSSGSSLPKFTYTTYYNISQSSTQKSYCELRSDMSFAFIDKNDFGISEYNGTYTQDKDLLTLTANEDGRKIEFKIIDEKNLLLQSDVGVSATGDKFTSEYKESGSGSSSGKEVPCTAISSKYNNYWAVEGVKNYDLEATVTPADTTDKITYTSEDEKVVKVDENGLCTAVAPGNTKIHIKCGSIERIVGFETRAKKVAVTSVSVEPKKVTVNVDGSDQITAKVSPDNATDKTITYKSNDPGIATVDSNGIIKGVSPGVTKVVATSADGVKGECDVCVEGETVIFEMQNNVSVKAGSGEKIPYKATWIMCYDFAVNSQDVTKEVQFHTAYTSALDIDGNGNVYAKGAVYETVDIAVHFSFTDGSSFYVQSPEFIVHVEK